MKRIKNGARKGGPLRELAGLLLLVLGLVSLLSLLSYDARDASWFFHQPEGQPLHNWIGRVGATLAETLLQLLGVAAYLVPVLSGALGLHALRRRRGGSRLVGLAACTVMVLALCSLLDLLYGHIAYGGEQLFPAGGYVGQRAAAGLRALLNTTGAFLFSATTLVGVLIVTTRLSLGRGVELLSWAARSGWAGTSALARSVSRAKAHRAPQTVERPPAPLTPPTVPSSASPRLDDGVPGLEEASPAAASPKLLHAAARAASRRPRRDEAPPRQSLLPMEPPSRGYALPPIELLQEGTPQAIESESELLERARQITEKLREFQIHGSVVAVHPGPVVTTFEFKPEAGVKYSRITGMTDDLSLALRAESVRIDRLPGRSTVGIEVPNRQQETIFPRDLLASERFRSDRSKLTLALGKAINGDVFATDLDRMPHLLIAGATGSGKSVGLNGMIVSILYKATPEEVRFIMIDTKMIELGVYAGIPHLLIPVVTEPKLASTALKWAVREMEQRYRKLASVGVRNILQFNTLLAAEPGRTMDDPKTGQPIPLAPLPYIVIVIDELADLMMVSSADVEESIMRLAQMARAVGIHLIIATQRPSVDVITGTIKANFPSRIAFRVSQRVDSRTIIDQQGAEHLLGRGDMLFLKTGSSRLIRVHGGLITEAELTRITSFLKKMAQPIYDDSVLREAEEEPTGYDGGERDEMYLRAVRTVIEEGRCSITLIQRRLQLGYARAARIVDMMEQEGVVSPGEGSKPREVLVGPEFLETSEAR